MPIKSVVFCLICFFAAFFTPNGFASTLEEAVAKAHADKTSKILGMKWARNRDSVLELKILLDGHRVRVLRFEPVDGKRINEHRNIDH